MRVKFHYSKSAAFRGTNDQHRGLFQHYRCELGRLLQWDGDVRIEDDEQPLEGCTLLDVGWTRENYDRVMTGSDYCLRNSHAWDYEYHRPPQIVQH